MKKTELKRKVKRTVLPPVPQQDVEKIITGIYIENDHVNVSIARAKEDANGNFVVDDKEKIEYALIAGDALDEFYTAFNEDFIFDIIDNIENGALISKLPKRDGL